jgi:chromosome segregation protein
MTRIKKIIMQGFKSFAKRTEMVFGDHFNCVLGPNGSGKSNVLDALCFVLGKSSSRELRAEKSENLIYNGGKSKTPAKEGEVSIYFDNSKRTFPIDEDEVKISRIVKQGGQSKYKINNKTRTRQQIIELLSIGKIDPNGYNIILQGDIIRFVEMPTRERRQIIEEISGIGIYEDKKQKAVNEINRVDEKLKEADIVLAERETHLKELKKDRNQALRYKNLNDRIKENKATILDMKISAKKTEQEKYQKEIDLKTKEIEKYQKEVDDTKKEIAKRKELLEEINKEVEEKGDKEQVSIQKEIEKLSIDLGSNKNRIESCENEINRIEIRKSGLEKSLSDVKSKIDAINREKQELDSKIKREEKELQLILKKIESFKKENKMDNLDQIETDVDKIDKDLEKKQEEIQKLREEQQSLLREKDRLEVQISTIDEKITKVLEVEKENKSEIERLKQRREEFKKATLELNTRLTDDSSFAAQLSNARSKLTKLQEDQAKLNAKNASIKEHIAGGVAIEKIMEQKDKIKGIYGTVSELGKVKSEYSFALEVAAAQRLSSVVVETDKVAADCIAFLKKNKYGIATFLPMNAIKPVEKKPEIEQIAKSQGVRGFAIDLIEYDHKFKKIFSYVFGNTLVVENLEVARRIGIGNARMVTLDGDLTEITGLMQGGYRQRIKGLGFQEKEVTDEINNIEKDISDTSSIISRLEERRQENEEFITRLRELKANLEGEIIKSEKSLHLESEDLDVSKKLKVDLLKTIQETDKNMDKVQMSISNLNKDLANLKIKKQTLKEQISQLKNPSLIAELNAFEEKREQLRNSVSQSTNHIKTLDVQISTLLGPEQQNVLKITKQHEKEIEDFKKEIDTLKDKIKAQEKDLKEKEEKQKHFRSQFKELFSKRDKINQEVSKYEQTVNSKQEKAREFERAVNLVSLDNARKKGELAGLLEDFRQYDGVKLFKDKTEEQILKEIGQFEKMTQDIGLVNMRALEIYDQVEKEYNALMDKKAVLNKEREDVLIMMNEIDSKKKELFMKTFTVINENFKRMFSMLSTKGETYLEIEDENDIFNNGVLIKVRISGKRFTDIRGLSGGEKTLTALAFIFSIQEHEPASFYVLDEVDAALDKKNSEKLAQLIKAYSKRAQYIMISHNDGIIAAADNLYGVSMDQDTGVSKVISLKI